MATETETSTMQDHVEMENEPTVIDETSVLENGTNSQAENNDKPASEQPRKRPKLDLTVKSDRKRGKSMFGLLVGTLNKAKLEDKQRNATEAAKKRNLIDQRLQAKIAKETESVRKAEEIKRDRQTANRKEEELALKDSIQRSRHKRLLNLSNFLCTSDDVRSPESTPEREMEQDDTPSEPRSSRRKPDPLSRPARSHPPPIYFLPAILLPSQRAFVDRKKAAVQDAVEKEREAWLEERRAGIEEIKALRAKVEAEEARVRESKEKAKSIAEEAGNGGDQEQHMDVEDQEKTKTEDAAEDEGREVEPTEGRQLTPPDSKPSQGMDEDDAVEY